LGQTADFRRLPYLKLEESAGDFKPIACATHPTRFAVRRFIIGQ